jgi:hypothetical protein
MGVLHCCGGYRKTRRFILSPQGGYKEAVLDYLRECPVCGHTVVQVTRIDFDNNVSLCRKINEKGRNLYDNVEASILYEENPDFKVMGKTLKFFLNYNEFGTKKKCYSNLSSLKMGLFESENMPIKKKMINLDGNYTLSRNNTKSSLCL